MDKRTLIFNAKLAQEGKRLISFDGAKKEFIRKCPQNECNGFLSSRWHCGLCDTNVCNKCHMIKDTYHMCDENDVASVALLNKDSTHCPNRECNVLIHIYEGCDQAWCVKCHTAFNWKTGKIEHGRIHNPEYFQYMRQNGGMPREEDRCDWGELINYRPLYNALEKSKGRYIAEHGEYEWKVLNRNLLECFRMMNHVYYYERTKYIDTDNKELKKQSLRIKFLLGHIDEPEWLKRLITLEKISKRKSDYHDLCEMFAQCSSDIFREQIVSGNFDINPFKKLSVYFNENMAKHNKKYGTQTMFLNHIYLSQ